MQSVGLPPRKCKILFLCTDRNLYSFDMKMPAPDITDVMVFKRHRIALFKRFSYSTGS
ncbi:hypothetical protein KC19_10G056600 [Ceratodon purpureus]|uniref:Uncharacterized protein n=1 Tax=Ceratodon purpureus TaxID=3225 RepID=A0A8T0GM45_CERPU|nr:hypothetical protein KC19_10G056600 [Ceratodon purpureus]